MAVLKRAELLVSWVGLLAECFVVVAGMQVETKAEQLAGLQVES